MNLDDYRAMVAQEKADAESKKDQTETPVVETPETPVVETPEKKEETPSKLIVDGEEITLEDVKEWKNGYLRTQDYTKKTQDVANQRKEAAEALELYNYLKANPQVAQALLAQSGTPEQVTNALNNTTPDSARVQKLEQQLYDMMLQREIDMLTNKYPDFNLVEVLNTAQAKNLTSLEDAYKLTVASKPAQQKGEEVDADALRKQIRDELLKELQGEKDSTTTIISTQNGEPPKANKDERNWSDEEEKVRINMKMSVSEWTKWKKKK